MKKAYEKPTLAKRDKLRAIAAATPASGFTF
ncbi:putative RiPP precursor [Mesorhizobium sp.]|nr:putative RiPP precursor [Mesorhizobium sp.]